MLRLIIQILIWFLILPSFVKGALVESNACKNAYDADYNFDKMLIDVALDEEHKVLKFFMNTKIVDFNNMSSMDPVVTDVNTTTNRYTTLHATVWFQGQVIKDENLRLCEVIGVKNTTGYLQSPRFRNSTRTNATIVINPNAPFQIDGNLFGGGAFISGSNSGSKSGSKSGSNSGSNSDEDSGSSSDDTSATLIQSISSDSVENNNVESGNDKRDDADTSDQPNGNNQNGQDINNDGFNNVGYYNEDGNFTEVGTNGYYDANGNWINLDSNQGSNEQTLQSLDDANNNNNNNVENSENSLTATGSTTEVIPTDGGVLSTTVGLDDLATLVSRPSDAAHNFKGDHKGKYYNESNSFASSNKSIENLFSNSTGQLIGCPLYVNDSVYMYYEVDISDQFKEIGSFSARFAIISNDADDTLVGCNQVYVTPELSSGIRRATINGVLVLIIVTGVMNFFTITYSTYQEAQNPFIFIASTICNENLLKQLDATVQLIILYFQFALFTAALNLNFPGFYQPLLASLKWVGLLGFTIIRGSEFYSSNEQDNIYLTYNGNGINSLAYFGNFSTLGDNWWNFILTLIIWIFIQIGAQAFFIGIYAIAKMPSDFVLTRISNLNFGSNLKRTLYFILGVFVNNFMILFAYPFLVVTLYLFFINAQSNINRYASVQTLRNNAFSRNVSYDSLFSPLTFVVFKDSSTHQTIGLQVDSDLLLSLGLLILQNSSSFTKADASFNLSTIQTNGTSGSASTSGSGSASNITNTTNISYKIVQDGVNSQILIPPLVVAAICFSIWIIIAFYFIFRYLYSFTKKLKLVANKNVYKLYTSVNNLLVWSYFYHHYAPSKNYFVIVDIVCLFLRSIIVSLMQSSGLAQVVCMIILESCNVLLLFLINPFYLKLNWTTTRWMIPIAKLLVSFLCIPFISQLNISEKTRTYVSYSHFIIHIVIAIAFLCQLIYCFGRTIISIIKFQHEKSKLKSPNPQDKLTISNSLDDFNKQFEYQPLDKLLKPITKYNHEPYNNENEMNGDYNFQYHLHHGAIKLDDSSFIRSSNSSIKQVITNNTNSNNNNNNHTGFSINDNMTNFIKVRKGQLNMDEINNADFYYRSNTQYQLPNDTTSDMIDNGSMISDNGSFAKQQVVSQKRRRKNDYTTREGDLIFKKYMVNDEIDPEIKQLWESRNIWNNYNGGLNGSKEEESDLESNFKSTIDKGVESMTIASSTKSNRFAKFNFKNLMKSKNSVFEEKGFQVSRPRPLIVKTLSTINDELGSPTVVGSEQEKSPTNSYPIDRNLSTKTAKTTNTSSTGYYTSTTFMDENGSPVSRNTNNTFNDSNEESIEESEILNEKIDNPEEGKE